MGQSDRDSHAVKQCVYSRKASFRTQSLSMTPAVPASFQLKGTGLTEEDGHPPANDSGTFFECCSLDTLGPADAVMRKLRLCMLESV